MRTHLTIGDGIAQDTLEKIAGSVLRTLAAYEAQEDTNDPHYWNGYLRGTLEWILRDIQTAETVTAEMARFAELD